MIGKGQAAGIVITPSCDLAQNKVETISYLPIVPFTEFFSLPSILPQIRTVIDAQLKILNTLDQLSWLTNYTPPSREQIESCRRQLGEIKKNQKNKDKLVAIDRVSIALDIISVPHSKPIDASRLSKLFGSKWKEQKQKIIANQRADTHFLPFDLQPAEWSGVPCHSLVLFRYPFTAPIQIFNAAQDIALQDWQGWCNQSSSSLPSASQFASTRPIKRVRLASEFLADLIARFSALYGRIGSPDFTEATKSEYSLAIG